MALPALAWSIAFGYRPRALHIRFSQWLRSESRSTGPAAAMNTLLPFVIQLLQHQHAQGLLGSLEFDPADGMLEHPVWKSAWKTDGAFNSLPYSLPMA